MAESVANTPTIKALDWINGLPDSVKSLFQHGPDLSFLPHASAPKPEPYKDIPLPTDAAGATPEDYVENPNYKEPIEGTDNGPAKIAPTITDKEFDTLQTEAAKGNKFAMSMIDAYKPKYGDTAAQFESSLVEPFVKQLQSLPGEVSGLVSQQESLEPSVESQVAATQSEAEANVPGFTPQSPNAQTQGYLNQYAADSSPATLSADMAPLESGLKDLGNAAATSQKTFPYAGLISDLLNRYSYQVESPSYPAPPMNIPGIPSAIKELFKASTGTELSGSGTSSSIGIPDGTGLSTPTLPTSGTGSISSSG